MSDRLPPAIAVFFGRRPMLRLPAAVAARVSTIRYDNSNAFKNAFVEELSLAIAKAAERMRPDLAPALSIVLITDPTAAVPGAEVIELIRKACPNNVSFVPQWIGVYRESEIATWIRNAQCGVAFLLSTQWRDGTVQGGSLDRAYQSLILSLLATEASRVDPHGFDCFARLRYHSRGKIYKVAIDPFALPDFEHQADHLVRQSAVSSYLPAIDPRARVAAARVAPVEPAVLLKRSGSRAAIEPAVAEPLLCAAIAQSVTMQQVTALLNDWSTQASESVADLLQDLQIALTQWMVESSPEAGDPRLAQPLFDTGGFPLLHELRIRLTSHRAQTAFRNQTAVVSKQLADRMRQDLDRTYYELLPNDLNATQRLAITSELANSNGGATRVTITRHFPFPLVVDSREEILALRDLCTVLYSLEMHTA